MAGKRTSADHAPQPRKGEMHNTERQRVRESNDRDQEPEGERADSAQNRAEDEAVSRTGTDVDPDSAESEVNRDDMVDEEP